MIPPIEGRDVGCFFIREQGRIPDGRVGVVDSALHFSPCVTESIPVVACREQAMIGRVSSYTLSQVCKSSDIFEVGRRQLLCHHLSPTYLTYPAARPTLHARGGHPQHFTEILTDNISKSLSLSGIAARSKRASAVSPTQFHSRLNRNRTHRRTGRYQRGCTIEPLSPEEGVRGVLS